MVGEECSVGIHELWRIIGVSARDDQMALALEMGYADWLIGRTFESNRGRAFASHEALLDALEMLRIAAEAEAEHVSEPAECATEPLDADRVSVNFGAIFETTG